MAGSKLKSNFPLTWVLGGLLSASALPAVADTEEGEFSMSIMDVISFTSLDPLLTGQVKSGSIVVGDTVCIPLKNGETVARTVDKILKGTKPLDRADRGQIVGLMVQVDEKLVEKGAFLHSNCELEEVSE